MEIWPDLEAFKVKSVNDLVGLPFSKYNCWEICELYYREILKKELPTYKVDAFDFPLVNKTMLTEIRTPKWIILDKPEPNCIALMKLGYCSATVNHAGVILPDGRMLQAYESTGSIIVDPQNQLWKRIIKYYIKPNVEYKK